ncbi:hypothetical protein [Frondihabitans sp. PhB188]|uniref:hypothetical protein n=1 Tax=Frondihabitans sp. PhB188 TaxID=2485200 RepID=UPI000F47B21E|nr:hypothetical protein [Frondihabitans sp. PhB188]
MTDTIKRQAAKNKLRHFLATVEDYKRLQAAFPLSSSVNWLGYGQDDETRWTVVLHGAILRKYFAPRDKLKLSSVLIALRTAADGGEARDSDWLNAISNVEKMSDWGLHHVAGVPEGYTDENMLDDFFYGRYLHGDYGRWLISERAQFDGSDAAIHMTLTERANRVLSVATYIQGAIEGGHLTL